MTGLPLHCVLYMEQFHSIKKNTGYYIVPNIHNGMDHNNHNVGRRYIITKAVHSPINMLTGWYITV